MEELRRTQAQLIVSDRRSSVATLAAGAAHEINNPLSYVIANIDFVAEKVLPLVTPEIQSALTDAIEGARRVQGIVRALKTLSSTGENEESVPLDIKAPLEAAIHMAQNEIRHRARLVQELRPVPPVLGLEVQLGQVFLNLLINAAQAIPHGASNKHEVRVSTRVDERGQVVIEIADTGSGISEETRARLFVPFFTTKPIGVGTGLGLFIVQGIVQRHGGEITVESEVGRGSVFRVSLPPASASAARKKSSGPGITPPVRRGRILVIDDEPKVCSTIQRILGEHEVHTTCDARDGLSRLQAGERFDLILCDVMMPEMSGPDFDLAVRALDPALFARTYFISGGAFTDTTRAFIAANEHRLFDKPLDFVRLKGVLRALLG